MKRVLALLSGFLGLMSVGFAQEDVLGGIKGDKFVQLNGGILMGEDDDWGLALVSYGYYFTDNLIGMAGVLVTFGDDNEGVGYGLMGQYNLTTRVRSQPYVQLGFASFDGEGSDRDYDEPFFGGGWNYYITRDSAFNIDYKVEIDNSDNALLLFGFRHVFKGY